MKSFIKRITNPLILFVVNILVIHIVFLFFGRLCIAMDISYINVILLVPSIMCAVILLLFEKPIKEKLDISTRLYWFLTVGFPLVVYAVGYVICFFLYADMSVLSDQVFISLYFVLKCMLFIFVAVITMVLKGLFSLKSKKRQGGNRL
jgi:hypothetical protein